MLKNFISLLIIILSVQSQAQVVIENQSTNLIYLHYANIFNVSIDGCENGKTIVTSSIGTVAFKNNQITWQLKEYKESAYLRIGCVVNGDTSIIRSSKFLIRKYPKPIIELHPSFSKGCKSFGRTIKEDMEMKNAELKVYQPYFNDNCAIKDFEIWFQKNEHEPAFKLVNIGGKINENIQELLKSSKYAYWISIRNIRYNCSNYRFGFENFHALSFGPNVKKPLVQPFQQLEIQEQLEYIWFTLRDSSDGDYRYSLIDSTFMFSGTIKEGKPIRRWKLVASSNRKVVFEYDCKKTEIVFKQFDESENCILEGAYSLICDNTNIEIQRFDPESFKEKIEIQQRLIKNGIWKSRTKNGSFERIYECGQFIKEMKID